MLRQFFNLRRFTCKWESFFFFGCTGPSFSCVGSLLPRVGLPSCDTWALECMGSVVLAGGLVALWWMRVWLHDQGSTLSPLHWRMWWKSLSVLSDSLWPHGLCSPWNSLGQNTGVGSCFLLQGIFPTQGSNPGLPHCRQILYQLSHKWILYHWTTRQVLWVLLNMK